MSTRRLLAIKWEDKITYEEVKNKDRTTRNRHRHNSKPKAIRTHMRYACYCLITVSSRLMLGEVKRTRPQGRPARRWIDNIKEWTGKDEVALQTHDTRRKQYCACNTPVKYNNNLQPFVRLSWRATVSGLNTKAYTQKLIEKHSVVVLVAFFVNVFVMGIYNKSWLFQN